MSDIQKTGLGSLDKMIEGLEQRASILNQNIADNTKIAEQKHKEVKELDAEIVAKRQQLDDQISAKQSTLKTVSDAVLKLEDKKGFLVNELNELNIEKDVFTQKLKVLTGEIQDSKKELEQLEQKKTRAKDIPEIKIKQDLIRDIGILQAEYKKVDERLREAEKEYAQIGKEISLVTPKLAHMEDEFVKLEQQTQQLKNNIEKSEADSSEKLKVLLEERGKLVVDIADLGSRKAVLNSQNEEITKLIDVQKTEAEKREAALKEREQSLVFQINTLAIKEKKLKQREDALSVGLEISE